MKKHILVVEDSPVYREVFCHLLANCFPDAVISAAADGTAALSITREQRFDLLILDYQLGALSGGDVVRHLRRRTTRTGPLMPIVLMSAQPEAAVFARTMGATAFLAKPVDIDELFQVIGPLLEESGSQSRSVGGL